MKRTTEKINKMTKLDLTYDGIQHTSKLSDYASSVQEYVDRVKDDSIFVKSRTFDKHIKDNVDDIKIVSFSTFDSSTICYAFLYKGSLSPFFVHGSLS